VSRRGAANPPFLSLFFGRKTGCACEIVSPEPDVLRRSTSVILSCWSPERVLPPEIYDPEKQDSLYQEDGIREIFAISLRPFLSYLRESEEEVRFPINAPGGQRHGFTPAAGRDEDPHRESFPLETFSLPEPES